MKVERLFLRNYRNITETFFSPDSHLNFLIGLNGQGKTSVIEAIGLLATLKSFRGSTTDEIIKRGQTETEIKADVTETGGWKTELKLLLSNGTTTSKTAFINGKLFKSSTQYLSCRFANIRLGFHAIAFNPSDHELVRGEPAGRRAYLNRVIAAEEIEYLKAVQRYQRLIEQRNTILKDEKLNKNLLASFTDPLADVAAYITDCRLAWFSKLQNKLDVTVRSIAPSIKPLSVVYFSSWLPKIDNLSINNKDLSGIHFTGQWRQGSLELLKQVFKESLLATQENELRARTTLVGPHRDDWSFFLGDQRLKGHGSQGEVRSALLALKLSEIDLFQARTGENPVLLLDDFSSELDKERRQYLLAFLLKTNLQVFVTTTEDFTNEGKKFHVEGGTVSEE